MYNIQRIINELKQYEGKQKSKVLSEAIQERLDVSLVSYYNELTKAFDKLYEYSDNYEIKLLKKLNKGDE